MKLDATKLAIPDGLYWAKYVGGPLNNELREVSQYLLDIDAQMIRWDTIIGDKRFWVKDLIKGPPDEIHEQQLNNMRARAAETMMIMAECLTTPRQFRYRHYEQGMRDAIA